MKSGTEGEKIQINNVNDVQNRVINDEDPFSKPNFVNDSEVNIDYEREAEKEEASDEGNEKEACLKLDTPPETKYFYLNSNAQKIRILTSENPTQR